MDITITKTTKEPLLKRTAFEAKMIFSGKTPSRIDMKKDLVHKLSSKDELTHVRKIATDYGSERAIISGYFYDDEATFKKLENRYVGMRHLTKKDRAAEKEKIKAAKLAAAPTTGKKKK